MCGGSDPAPAPAAPDPYETADAQWQYAQLAAQYGSFLNAIDQYGPSGSTVWARRADGTPYAQTITLSPEDQALRDSQYAASTKLNNAAMTQLGFLPTDRFTLPESPDARQYSVDAFGNKILDYNQFVDPRSVDLTPKDTAALAQTSYEQAMALQQPGLDQTRKEKGIELVNRGIPVGSEIYNAEMARLDSAQNQAQQQASRQAILDAGNEQSRQFGIASSQRGILGTEQNQQFNQLGTALGYGNGAYQQNLSNVLLERNRPYEEAAALLGTAPSFSQPGFANTAAAQVQTPNYEGVVNNNYAQQISYANAQNAANAQSNSGLMSGLGSIGGALITGIFSDENLKENRKQSDGEVILMHLRDIPVDDYDYIKEARYALGVPEHRTGPMAQDWQEHFPEGSNGHMIDMADILGKLLSSVKALDARTAGKHRSTRNGR